MAAESEFTIDQLARAADITVRSVRVYHERGLLPSPEVRGRIGYYRPDHLDRLQTISRLLGRGMKLNGIRELLDAWDRGDGLADVLGVVEEETEVATLDHLRPTNGADPLDAYRAADPHCFALAGRLADTGMPAAAVIDLVERFRADCAQLADRYGIELVERLTERPDGPTQLPDERDADLAAARLLATRAAAETIGQAFAKQAPPAR